MLYLDSSALIKCYVQEIGSAAVLGRLRAGEPVLTSWLAYAEVVTVLGRKQQSGQFGPAEYNQARADFDRDWTTFLQRIELNARALAALPELTSRYPLKAADAVHLATALWMQSQISGPGKPALEFGVADHALGRVAASCGLRVFDPEATTP